jgi:two-component system chemotaxis sensor kinase CheA
MDVVKTNIGKLGGIVDVQSEIGIGTRFTITLPITLAIISALLVRVDEHTYAVPLASVQEAIQIEASSVRNVEGREVATIRGESLVLYRLTDMFRLRGTSRPMKPGKMVVVVSASTSRRCGFVVDAIVGRQDIIIKPLSGPLHKLRGFAGATELGDQRVALVVDMLGLIEEVHGAVQSRVDGAN